jgi:hypothetical protein
VSVEEVTAFCQDAMGRVPEVLAITEYGSALIAALQRPLDCAEGNGDGRRFKKGSRLPNMFKKLSLSRTLLSGRKGRRTSRRMQDTPGLRNDVLKAQACLNELSSRYFISSASPLTRRYSHCIVEQRGQL